MKVNEIESGRIFIFGPTLSRPKLKLKGGFLDIVSRYMYACWGDRPATILAGDQIYRLRLFWRMTEEEFEKFRRALISKYSNEKEIQ